VKNRAGDNVFKAHDDRHPDECPVIYWLRCCRCERTQMIRTISYDALRRTAERAGWRWIDWPVDCTAKVMTCRQCVAKPHNERADNGPTSGT
jgi:hypothetical protein